jgi:sec-independent protein translocase protein TatA
MSFGVVEVLVIVAVILVFFGAGKLPTVMGDLAKGVRNFKQGLASDEPAAPAEVVSAAAARPPPPPPPALLDAPTVESAPEPRRG